MDLREYYAKIRAKAETIPDAFVVIVSNATADGGRDGIKTEVARQLAAKLLAEDKARLASEEETTAYYTAQQAALEKAGELQEEGRIQLAVLSEAKLEALAKSLSQARK
ncbi:MAG: hypothetical protein R2729_01420 [Bryobacteraceae bacterium]